jgi:uncharacterized protein YifN (PemK superfamily)
MPLLQGIYPSPGQVLICDFGPEPGTIEPPGLMAGPLGVPPELFKLRPVVVISPGRGLSTVVPFSTVAPKTPQKYHLCIPAGRYEFLDADADSWAKTDLLGTESNLRLDRPFVLGTRRSVKLVEADFRLIRESVLHWIGLSRLTMHL